MKSSSLLLFVLLFLFNVHTQTSLAQDSSRIRISLLTCTPGDELYSIFGHSAIRIIDSNSVTDYVFNYGTFNFEDDGFYLKFIRGKLLYFLSCLKQNQLIFFQPKQSVIISSRGARVYLELRILKIIEGIMLAIMIPKIKKIRKTIHLLGLFLSMSFIYFFKNFSQVLKVSNPSTSLAYVKRQYIYCIYSFYKIKFF